MRFRSDKKRTRESVQARTLPQFNCHPENVTGPTWLLQRWTWPNLWNDQLALCNFPDLWSDSPRISWRENLKVFTGFTVLVQTPSCRIPMVVDGSDLVDLDAQDLLDLLSSWEGQRPPVPPGMRVACAPDRRKHEELGGLGVSWGRWMATFSGGLTNKRVDLTWCNHLKWRYPSGGFWTIFDIPSYLMIPSDEHSWRGWIQLVLLFKKYRAWKTQRHLGFWWGKYCLIWVNTGKWEELGHIGKYG